MTRTTTLRSLPLLTRLLYAAPRALLFVVLSAAPGSADTQSSLGNGTGEGSTPFTGLAQAPEAQLFTGTMATSIPIEVPPGRKTVTPKLALIYSSAGGPGPYGYGWDLPLGKIERTTKWGAPHCYSQHFNEFVLSMPGLTAELVEEPVNSDVYRPRIEDSYFEAKQNADGSWTAYDRSGTKYLFGATTQARLISSSTFVCGAMTTVWHLSSVQDSNGNTLVVNYTTLDGIPYPQSVKWGGNVNWGGPNFNAVTFTWQARPGTDTPTSYGHSAKMAFSHRLQKIDVDSGGTFIRSYGFGYDLSQAPAGPRSMLGRVSVTGYPNDQIFTYEEDTGHTFKQYSAPPNVRYLRRFNDSLEVSETVMDIDGDGRVDKIFAGDGPWAVYLGCSPVEPGSTGSNPSNCGTYGFATQPVTWDSHMTGFSAVKVRNVLTNCSGSPQRCVQYDTFDITGDGIADYVVAADTLNDWRVYPGQVNGSFRGFADNYITWSAPVPYINTQSGSTTHQDVRDMNGDGLLDLVVANSATWTVYTNLGDGFDGGRPHAAPHPAIEHEDVPGAPSYKLLDFNGDALPDVVYASNCVVFNSIATCLYVYFNTGVRFESAGKQIVLGYTWSARNGGSTHTDLLDINGDGLPDHVTLGACDVPNSKALVALNTGGDLEPPVHVPATNRFIPPREWPSLPCGLLRQVVAAGDDLAVATDLIDFDGNGTLDLVEANRTPWNVHLNNDSTQTAPRAKLLTAMENGAGSETTVRYRPSTAFNNRLPFVSWVTAAIRRTDGLCEPGNPPDLYTRQNPCVADGHELVSRFDYQEGKFDGDTREFRGFRLVKQLDVDNNATVIEFHQDVDLKGRMLRSATYAGATTPVRREDYSWQHAQFQPGSSRRQVWLGQRSTTQWDGTGSGLTTTTTNDRPDQYGNVGHSVRTGSGITVASTLHVYTTYAATFGSRVLDKPQRILKTNGNGTPLQDQWLYYDGFTSSGQIGTRGNVTKIEQVVAGSTKTTTTLTYNFFGNPELVTDPLLARITTTYDPYTDIFPWKVTNEFGHVVTTEYDHRWGQIVSSTDQNGAVTTYTYDGVGRLKSVIRPEDSVALPSEKYDYFFRNLNHPANLGVVSGIAISKRDPGAQGGYLTTVKYFDGLGRSRGSAAPRQIGSATSASVVITDDVDFDAAGNIVTRYDPYVAGGVPRNNGAMVYEYGLNGGTAVDPLGRIYRVTQPNGESTRALYKGTARESFDELGYKTVETFDADRNIVKKEIFDGTGSLYTTTAVAYDALGRPIFTTQSGNGTSTTLGVEYDMLGRRTKVVDPDSGTWTYQFDPVGNVIFENDPKPGQSIRTCYDKLRRVTKRYYLPTDFDTTNNCSSVKWNELYTYDQTSAVNRYGQTVNQHPGIGRLAKVEEASGDKSSFIYDLRGRTVETTKTIVVGKKPKTASMSFAYDTADRVTLTTYPDAEGFSVATTYNRAGQPRTLSGVVSAVEYDLFGRVTRMARANGTTDKFDYYGLPNEPNYDNNHRLQAIRVLGPGNNVLLGLGYNAYTARSQIEVIEDLNGNNAGTSLSNTKIYAYDFMGRLESAFRGSDNHTSVYTYDALGNITSNDGRPYMYGNSAKPHQVTAVGTDAIKYQLNGSRKLKGKTRYTYDKRDLLTKVKVGAQKSIFRHDYTGMRVVKRTATPGRPEMKTRYFSTFFELTGDAQPTQLRRYFLGGLYVASEEKSVGVTAYAGATGASGSPMQFFAKLQGGHPTLHLLLDGAAGTGFAALAILLLAGFFVGSPRRRRLGVVSVRVVPTFTLAIVVAVVSLPWAITVTPMPADAQTAPMVRHLHYDHLGSTQLITDASGLTVLQPRYEAWGQVRGRFNSSGQPVPVAANNRYEFTGYESDTSSGLEYAGARFYDPDLGLYLTHDPARQFANPYAYGPFDPANGNDPTGQSWALIFAAASFLATTVETAVRTGDVAGALGMGVFSAVVSFATLSVGKSGLGVLERSVSEATFQNTKMALQIAGVASSAYRANSAASQGNYGSAGIAAALASFGMFEALAAGEPGSDGTVQPYAGVPRSAGMFAATADYARKVMRGDMLDLLGGMFGTAKGIGDGLYKIGAGLLTLNPTKLARGLFDLLTPIMPRLGSHGGLNYPGSDDNSSPFPSTGTKLNNASMVHDSALSGDDASFWDSRVHATWIKDAWTGPGVEPGIFGQAYRILGTVGFGAASGGIWLTGY